MKILAYNAGHDGCAALIDGGQLIFALEAEKDSGSRHAVLSPNVFIRSLELGGVPDAIAISGWHTNSGDLPIARSDAGYVGIGSDAMRRSHCEIAGKEVRVFHTSHERSHILCSYGLSEIAQEPCYVLVWEGMLGAFYHIDSNLVITKIGDVLDEPGTKYAFLYGLADPLVPMFPTVIRMEDAGKLMALAAYGTQTSASATQSELIESILSMPPVYSGPRYQAHKSRFKDDPICNAGPRSEAFRNIARLFSDALFARFFTFAKENLTKRLPLLISGGCGLNCEWNSRWADCGLFSSVFVPPCTNDSGVAIGGAIDAQLCFTGNAKVSWSVYAGELFVHDIAPPADVESEPLDLGEICDLLVRGCVLAWVQGRYEIGPRALGHRSLLAAPFAGKTRDRLNKIKQREEFRPIAPICLEDDFRIHFESTLSSSPYMLYFQRVRTSELAAVTHVDNSARAQTVSQDQDPLMHALLKRFKERTGYGVLCNTSLNFKGSGFINRMSDLIRYASAQKLDGFVVGDRLYRFRAHPGASV